MTETLGFGITFEQLYRHEGIAAIDARFIEELKASDVELHNRLAAARTQPESLEAKAESELITALAPHLQDFIARLFGIEKESRELAERHDALAPLYSCKRLFVQRRALKSVKPDEAASLEEAALLAELAEHAPSFASARPGAAPRDAKACAATEREHTILSFELPYAKQVMEWLEAPDSHEPGLTAAARYAAWAVYTQAGQEKHKHGLLFKTPGKLNFDNLVPLETELRDGVTVMRLPKEKTHQRKGFALTDPGASLEKALDEANYCIFCHNQGRDSCSKGLKEKDGSFRKSPTRVPLAGCPLEEHISEMNLLKSQGCAIGALATTVIANPMCAGTGHRICNDCMKACVYQKQDPVDIPQIETRNLKDVLSLPFGFEIYSLLTRWNPLDLARPIPRPPTGKRVLVVGLGPAGYTLAHHLLNDGHTVVAIDGLKIEPLPSEFSGRMQNGELRQFSPVRDINVLYENLDERLLAGFGGVAEYGITVRWDKNFLKIIRLLIERRSDFTMFGGVRFGGTLTIDDAWNYGFDHIALCMGAGKPTVIDMENAMARGVRTASDFLMALQLTGAAKQDSIANLQLRLPVVVIGGGLTAIDTATESLAYYPVQVEKFLSRYEALLKERGEQTVRSGWSKEETEIAEEFIAHARAIRSEREQAAKENREADIWSLLDHWGGVKLIYRRQLIDAPSYRLNHEEVEKAFQEGIFFAEQWEPVGVELDEHGHAKAIRLRSTAPSPQQQEAQSGDRASPEPASCDLQKQITEADNNIITLPARAILIAAGTSPNTVLQREYPQHVRLHGKYFQAVDEDGQPVEPEWSAKPAIPQVLMSREEDGRAISFFGDLHPSFAGNVVKAMASAKQGYPVISRVLQQRPTGSAAANNFIETMNGEFRATVHAVHRLTPTIVEVVVKAPAAARKFQPGQFYRLQNFETNAPRTLHASLSTVLAMEGIAMTGAWVDKEQGLVSVIALEMGGSSDLCAHLEPGEPVILMGPTGTPTEIPADETVMLVGGGLGNAVLFSIGKAMREAGSKVLYFAGYKKAQDRYKVAEIEAAADIIIWCCDESLAFTPGRPQDKSFHGNIVEAMLAYENGTLGDKPIGLDEVDRIIAIGSDRMMQGVALARHTQLKPFLKPGHIAIGSINSPMQCMMKEICAQCLQKHIDPVTGEESYVFSCFNQDQLLDHVSFPHLHERLQQNGVQEKLTAQWIDSCLHRLGLRQNAA